MRIYEDGRTTDEMDSALNVAITRVGPRVCIQLPECTMYLTDAQAAALGKLLLQTTGRWHEIKTAEDADLAKEMMERRVSGAKPQ